MSFSSSSGKTAPVLFSTISLSTYNDSMEHAAINQCADIVFIELHHTSHGQATAQTVKFHSSLT